MNPVLTAAAPPAHSADYARVRALVVDENAAARMAVKALLQSIGVDNVQQAAEPVRAIRMMELDAFDLVLCEARFPSQMDGLQVLEYVRTRRLLQPSAAFVMLSGGADRALVAAVREWQPDGFVLKPLTAGSLIPRIEQALRLRRVRAPLYEAADRNDAEAVLGHARRLAQTSGGPSLEMLRWQAHALIDLGRFAQARETCQKAQAIKQDVPWVEVALGHCERADGRLDRACERMRATILAHPFLGGAYDLLIELLQEQGETAGALQVARSALEQLATSQRMRTLGEIAYAHGDFQTAEQSYADLIRKTSTSLTRTTLDIGMLGQVYVTQGNADKALRLMSTVEESADPPSQALAASVQAQAFTVKGDAPAAEDAARRAIAFAGASAAPESVAMLVAQGALAAGMRDEAEALVTRTMQARRRQSAPGALARKVIAAAGMDPASFSGPTAAGAPAAADDWASAIMPTEPVPDLAEPGNSPSDDVARALDCLHQAKFHEAVAHVDRARAQLPANPMVLMASVQVHLLKMRATGFDADAARTVRRCLVEIDRQVPGDERVFQFAGG